MESSGNNSPSHYILSQGEVHLWQRSLNEGKETIKYLFSILSVDERERAERFYQVKHRQEFILARGMLRVILGRYVGEDPASLVFKYSSKGKPSLSAHQLSFNLSHSQDLVIYAVSYLEKIGVDLEYQRKIEVESLAKRFFSLREYQYLKNVDEQEELFFRLWTAKEAYLKATGEGIAGGLEQAEITIGDSLSLPTPWSLSSFIPQAGYYGALVCLGQVEKISMFKLN